MENFWQIQKADEKRLQQEKISSALKERKCELCAEAINRDCVYALIGGYKTKNFYLGISCMLFTCLGLKVKFFVF